jgi:hypothetical protein
MTPIFPGDPKDQPIVLHRDGLTPQPMKPEELDALKRGAAYIAIYGAVIYRDQFGSHWTRFCSFGSYQPGFYTTHWCTAFNHLGEGHTVSLRPEN